VTEPVSFGAAVWSGLVAFLTPGVPFLLVVFASFSFASVLPPHPRAGGVWPVLPFAAGFAVAFVLAGSGASAAGRAVFDHQAAVLTVAGTVAALWGAGAALVRPGTAADPARWLRKPFGWPVCAVAGAAFGVAWTPCVGPVLGEILLLASGADTLSSGVRLLSVHTAVLCVPLLSVAFLCDRLARRLAGRPAVLRGLRLVAGGTAVAAGLLAATGLFTRLGGWLLTAFEPWADGLMGWGV
jgi:cytochrome c-type biogenesis protein